ncbi:triose-phosphate isomerase [Alteromonas sp. ASW11-130]|uniref:triose-phosphate isomerase n=1 Tax=Alteromonas sp. ASW11-130 TaxID=3015775 RepID=UPI002242886B|nr:triose-phosphate isomerase [Alteromonas sp. ASW11-130]MCW8092113.1 triose-phosphate isomerase [Alteromonas sp. ASW11-130]
MEHNRVPMVAGNWKMNGDQDLVNQFSKELKTQALSCAVVICPPSVYLPLFSDHDFSLGAQNVSHLQNGAHTGELSVSMLKEVGADYVIVGHSERRESQQESSKLVAQKAKNAVEGGLTPIVCVGEPLNIREQETVEPYIAEQLKALTELLSVDAMKQCVIAYEPIWAIGTGKTATPQQAQEVHAFIRRTLNAHAEELGEGIRLLYGGSVKADNAKQLFSQPDVDGGLIGGASLKVEDFIAICRAAN